MTVTWITGPTGSGKTHAAVEAIADAVAEDAIQRIWVLLPSELQVNAFRARLTERVGICFGVELFDFYSLYHRLLQELGDPQRSIQDTARFRVLRHVLTENQQYLKHFGAIADTPGFVRVAADFIQELKQARIEPDRFQSVAKTPKDQDLALIYSEYQTFLQTSDLVDSEGEGWLALADLEKAGNRHLGLDMLIVDGFDQFNIVQAQLLGALATRVRSFILTLTYDETRLNSAHRRFAQTRIMLEQFLPRGVERRLDLAAAPRRAKALEQLTGALFEYGVVPIPNDDAVTLIEAPDARREVEEALRMAKQAILSGVSPDRIAIIARDLSGYLPYLFDLTKSFGLPVSIRGGIPLRESPVIAAILSLIDLADGGVRRRSVIDALQNVYLTCPDLNPSQIALLDRISREQIVTRDREMWLSAIRAATAEVLDDETDEPRAGIPPEEAEALSRAMEEFFDRVTPPEQATAREFVAWIEGLIGDDPLLTADEDPDLEEALLPPLPVQHFGCVVNIRAGHAIAPEFLARDLNALRSLMRVFRDLIAGYDLVETDPIPWSQFRLDLGIAIENTQIRPEQTRAGTGRIFIGSVYEARGLPHEVVFLLGLSEGMFPVSAREDEFYLDTERIRFNEDGGLRYLITRAGEADETSLFYEVTALARRALVLTRPYSDNGTPWPPSPYWNAVCATLAEADAATRRIPMVPRLDPMQAGRLGEFMVALAQRVDQPATKETEESIRDAIAAIHWLERDSGYGDRWQNVYAAYSVEQLRRAGIPSAYSGTIQQASLKDYVRELLGPGYTWSASQLDDYGICPYRFFARRVLGLEELREPEPGADSRRMGTIVHRVLELSYRQFNREGLDIRPENAARAKIILDDFCAKVFHEAPETYGFRPDALWKQEQETTLKALTDLIQKDFSGEGEIGKLLSGVRRSEHQEVGFDQQGSLIITGAAGNITVRGIIDRIDVANGQAIVVDYKTGSIKIPIDEMVEGRNVQLLLYALGARQILPDADVIGGLFLNTKKGSALGKVLVRDHADELQAAESNLIQRVIAARDGNFAEEPSKPDGGKCNRFCEFSQLCRSAERR